MQNKSEESLSVEGMRLLSSLRASPFAQNERLRRAKNIRASLRFASQNTFVWWKSWF